MPTKSLPENVDEVRFWPGSLAQRPVIAPLVMQVIEIWAHTEAAFARLVAALLKTEPVVATSMFQAIDNQTTQRAAIMGAARAVLSEGDFLLLECCVHSTAASRKDRHCFAHHMWGVSTQVPDALLSIDPKDYNASAAEFKAWSRKALSGATGSVAFPLVMRESNLLRPFIRVWTESALAESVVAAERAHRVTDLLTVLAFMEFSPSCDPIRHMLNADPLIQARIQKAKRNAAPS